MWISSSSVHLMSRQIKICVNVVEDEMAAYHGFKTATIFLNFNFGSTKVLVNRSKLIYQ